MRHGKVITRSSLYITRFELIYCKSTAALDNVSNAIGLVSNGAKYLGVFMAEGSKVFNEFWDRESCVASQGEMSLLRLCFRYEVGNDFLILFSLTAIHALLVVSCFTFAIPCGGSSGVLLVNGEVLLC